MNTKCNKEQFIEKSKTLFGKDSFDYSKVEYVNGYTEITLICKKHGEFSITPNKHLDIVGGCPQCSKEKRKKRKSMSNEEYKALVVEKHGHLYDLSKTEYMGMRDYVTATCPIHGDFKIVAYDLVHKRGCPQCGRANKASSNNRKRKKENKKLTTEIFVSKAREVFGDYYDYSKTDLNNKDEKGRICIICPKHGEFWQNPFSHLHGHHCSKCGKEKGGTTQSLTTEKFIEKAKQIHCDKYDYSETKYNGCYEYVDIICPKHGKFRQVAYSHLNGHGCKECSNEINSKLLLSNTEEFVEKANKLHYNENDYRLVQYKGAKVPVTIICKNGHIFSQMPNKHLSGHSCPYCTNNISRQEKEIVKHIKSLGFNVETNNRKLLPNNKEIDIYIPEKKVAIEFDGLYWHNEIKKPDKNYHLNKTIDCYKNDIRLIHIFEDEWLYNKEIVKSRINSILGKTTDKIYARQCELRSVDSKTSKQFLNENHLQGGINSSIRYGLYYKNELVSIMTFCKPRKNLGQENKSGEYELLRFCNKINTTVVGGASKLFKHFIKQHNPNCVVSYADRRWNIGGVYEKMDFKFTHYSKPNSI